MVLTGRMVSQVLMVATVPTETLEFLVNQEPLV
jgi:hypothetical protein